MPRSAGIAGLEFGFPLVQQAQRRARIADLVTQIVRNAAVGVNIEKMLTEAFRQKPSGHEEIFVMGAGQAAAVLPSFSLRSRPLGNRIFRGKTAPPWQGGRNRGRPGVVAGNG